MDRDWERRNYNPLLAFAQRSMWGAPLLVALLLMGLLESPGLPRESSVVTALLVCGALGSLAMLCLSVYRWMAGYCRSAFQERAAQDHRKNPARSCLRFHIGR
jgi:hypothetical protein